MPENTEELRRRIKQRTPRCDLAAAHLQGAKLLPSREDLLDRLPKAGVVAEVGVGFGDFSASILERAAPRILYLIDSWSSPRYAPGRAAVEARFAEEIASGRVVVQVGTSVDGLATLPDAALDWIYIDSDHTYQTAARELALALRKVRRSGRIAGHDWTTGNCILPWPYGVIEAAHEFCVTYAWRYEFLTMEAHGHLSFCLAAQPHRRPRRRA